MSKLRIVKLLDGMSTTVVAGGLVPKGAYDSLINYAVGDSVDYNGSSYVMYSNASAGTVPTNTTYWQVLADKGETGSTGATGPQGIQGIKGDTGEGVVAGGTAGQVLAKASATDYDTEWVDEPTSDVTSVNTKTGTVVLTQDDVGDGITYKQYSDSEKTKLSGVETGAEVNNISDVDATGLTYGGDTSIHYHSSDRDRTNHTGTQTASTISDFNSAVSSNLDVSANTTAKHTHANKVTLDNTEESLTTALKLNYDGAHTHAVLTTGNPHSITKSDVGLGSVTNEAQIPLSQKGSAGGVAELDASGTVPTTQLPSYVDDVLEYTDLASFPATGETGKIYIANDTNKTYRWSGSSYVEISSSLALGETSSTAYYGDKGKTAYDHSQLAIGNPHNVSLSDVGGTTDHTALSNIGTNTHAQIDTALTRLANTSGTNTGDQDLSSYDLHLLNTSNPHSVSKSDVGLSSVPDLDTTGAVANSHTHTNQAQLDLVTDGDHDVRTDNPHAVTKTDVGLSNVTNVATDDTPYDSVSWDTNTDAPTKNVVRDKFVTNDAAIALNTAKRTYPSADETKVGYISVTQAVDLDAMESDITTNNAKVTNATHIGEVTGSGALTVDKTAITSKTAVTASGADYVLLSDTSDTGNLKKALVSDLGATDHGALTGLTNDDHTQYLLVSGVRSISGDWDVDGAGTLYVDKTNGRLGVNTTSPSSLFDLSQTTDDASGGLRFSNISGTKSGYFYINSSGSFYSQSTAQMTFSPGSYVFFNSKSDVYFNLGDAAGVRKVIIRDNTSTQVFTVDSLGNVVLSGTVDGRDIASDGAKLDGIESGADVTDATNVASAGAVMNTGDETVAGVKTFSSFPITPSSAPTTNYQAANKKYVDDNSNLSPLTTKGDLYGYDTDNQRLAVGTDGQALFADSTEATGLKWKEASATSHVIEETPTGSIDSSNTTYTLANTPVSGTVRLYQNGVRLDVGDDYTISSSTITMDTAPTTGDKLFADYMISAGDFATGSTSFTYNELVNETPNGSTTAFTVDNAYVAGSTQVFRDGQLMRPGGADYTETTPASGIITFTTAPATGSVILVTYQQSVSTVGNADTLDGSHLSALTLNSSTDVSGNSWVVDEDDMSSDSATKVPTQQSLKAYSDSAVQTLTNKDLTSTTNTFPSTYSKVKSGSTVITLTPNANNTVTHNLGNASSNVIAINGDYSANQFYIAGIDVVDGNSFTVYASGGAAGSARINYMIFY